ncbi:MAG: dihydroorotate dehydrogenase [Paracoccaceae bacterium]
MDHEPDLDTMFAMASRQRVDPSDGLTARILADAAAMQPGRSVVAATPRQGWLATLAEWLGGTGALAGMSAAALTGLYLGVVQPAPVQALTALLSTDTTIDSLDLLPSSDTLLAQE